MKSIAAKAVTNIATVYGGPQGDLYSLLMGQQLHVGGMNASLDLAVRAGIGSGKSGVDLCCGNGGGMRVLVRFCGVTSMVGVDLTPRNVERGERLCREEGFADRIRFVPGDACFSGLPGGSADFAWGEDAWCYVPDKARLIAEASRLVRRGGTIAFTDWVEGPAELTTDEAQRALTLMSFSHVQDIGGYAWLLKENGCEVLVAEDTGRMAAFFDLALNMTETQFTYDMLATMDFQKEVLAAVKDSFRFFGDLARARKLVQARFVARRKEGS